ncbi:site-2 protease family protein [Methanotrichaceae archaeon M04Ac]|uniref:Site-2 protease family protein n=1 Tax=Candidatus Methanocrinis alkalitolerans TaxID=3033395 RepID=A0ABT5XF42_9EURY|nr:site-2 protease family protein [Candidatus Methanocrinis alkalitolerans]MCR3883522.1 site-2 protease family protein [Methanothrix sp.]MDF0593282.1 site-2 protease family protein [Candidatus Methanocrinis alkalitolerans]
MEFTWNLTLFDWLLIAILALNIHWLLAIRLSRLQSLKGLQLGNWGPVIMIKTTRWLTLIDRLSRPKRFWRGAITAGIPLVVLGMLSFLALFLLLTLTVLRTPPEPSVYTAPRNVLLIPGINQFIPLWWGWVALFVTMAVHEFSHGILCRVEGIRVKSMGIALLAAPVAAFVEPDEGELFGSEDDDDKPKATRAARIRILSAGVIANFVVAALALALFFGPVIGAIAPMDRVVVVDVAPGSAADLAGFERQMILLSAGDIRVDGLEDLVATGGGDRSLSFLLGDEMVDLGLGGEFVRGVVVSYVFEGSAADDAGIVPGATISEIDGVPTPDWESFRSAMNSTTEGDTVVVGTNRGDYVVDLAANPDGSGSGFLGVGFSGVSANAVYLDGATFQEFPAGSFLAALREMPRSGVFGVFTLMGLPFSGIPGFTEMGFPGFAGWITHLFEPTGWAEPLGGKIFWIANFLFWVGLINLYAGLFNCLPAVPLDGGHIFRDMLSMGLGAVFKSEAKAERMTRALVTLMAWLIFSSLLFIIVAPYLAHGFGG